LAISSPPTGPSGLASLLPLILLVYATLIPQEVRFSFADQTLYAPRVVEILLLPWLLHQIASGRFPFRRIDWVFVIATAWMIFSFYVYYGSADSLQRSIPLALDTLVPYLVARQCIRGADDLRRLLVVAAPGFGVAGLLMAMESLLHVMFVRPFFAKLFGQLSLYQDGVAIGAANTKVLYRLGLLRVSGPFSHPILAGIYMASLLPLYWWSGLRGWPRLVGVAAGACFVFSVSSGAFLAVILGFGMAFYDRIQARVQFLNWTQALVGLTVVMIFLQVASENGAISVLTRLTLDPATAGYRTLIWEYGMQSVGRHPWFGIGLDDYERISWMGTTVDAHWLLLAIRHGLFVPVLMLAAFMAAMIRLLRFNPLSGALERCLLAAVAGSLFGMTVSGFTVAYFGGAMPWLYALLGMAISLGTRITPVPAPAPYPAPYPAQAPAPDSAPGQDPARWQRA
jgi:hypothetical protein